MQKKILASPTHAKTKEAVQKMVANLLSVIANQAMRVNIVKQVKIKHMLGYYLTMLKRKARNTWNTKFDDDGTKINPDPI